MPFSNADLIYYLDRHPISGRGRQFILEAAKGLSRDVGTAPGVSVIAEMQSRKMGVTTHTESQTGELAFAIHLEFDASVIAFYEQLPPVDCLRRDKNGKQVQRAYRADFLVLKDTGPVVVQVKHAQRVEELLSSKPDEWIERDGRAVDLPAERSFRELGLPHLVVRNTDLPQIRVSNLRTLLHVKPFQGELATGLASEAEAILDGHTALPIEALASALGLKDHTPILLMVLQKRIFALLDRQLLTQPDSCLITVHPSLLEAVVDRSSFDPNGAHACTVLTCDVPPKHECEVALKHLKAIEDGAQTRSARRWRKQVKDQPHLTPFQALLPRFASRGNRLPKRPPHVLEVALRAIEMHWASPKRPNLKNAYKLYRADARASHPFDKALSRKSFADLILREGERLAGRRGGRRSELAASPPSNVEDRALPATRPFERASLDSCLCKVCCILYTAEKVVYVARPWLSALVDHFTGQPLAWWISFNRPKKRAIAMVLRDCVRRHRRLPESIICDWGAEHRSVHLSSVCAHFQVELLFRPKQHSRFGAQVERFFGLLKSEWLDLRPGNRTDVKNIRNLSSTHHPSKFAVMDLVAFMAELEDYVAWYRTHKFTTSTDTCAHRMDLGLERYPHSGRSVTYGTAFCVYTAVDEKSLVVDPARGIKHNDQHYWHPELKLCRGSKKRVEVRVDPEDHTRIYARVKTRWVTCRSGRSVALAARDLAGVRSESLLITEGRKLLDDAKLAAEIELIKAIREADERLKNMPRWIELPLESLEAQKGSDGPIASQSDYWDEMNSTDVEELGVLPARRQS